MAPSNCPVRIDGRLCGLDLMETNSRDPKLSKIYVCERGHQPYCIPRDSFSPLVRKTHLPNHVLAKNN